MDLQQAFSDVVGSNQTVAIVVLILANFVLGVLAALKDGKFAWSELANIITDTKKVMPLIGYLLVSTVGKSMASPTGDVVANGAMLAGLPYLISTWKSLKSTGVPQVLTGTVAKTLNEVMGHGEVPPLERWAKEMWGLEQEFRTGEITAEAAQAKALLLSQLYGGPPPVPGWPGAPA